MLHIRMKSVKGTAMKWSASMARDRMAGSSILHPNLFGEER